MTNYKIIITLLFLCVLLINFGCVSVGLYTETEVETSVRENVWRESLMQPTTGNDQLLPFEPMFMVH